MAKKSKTKATLKPSQQANTSQTKSIPRNNGKNLGFRFVQGALMRAPFLLLGCLVLHLLKRNGVLQSEAVDVKESANSIGGFSLTQILVVNIVAEACVRVWWMILRGDLKDKGKRA